MLFKRNTPQITQWAPYIPTGGFTDAVVYTGHWRRVLDTLETRVTLTFSGGTNAANFTLQVPFGLTIDAAKINTAFADTVPHVGYGVGRDAGAGTYMFRAALNSTTQIIGLVGDDAANGVTFGTVTATNPFSIGASDALFLQYQVPIIGWR